jgi:hypothetical protein
MTMEPKRIYGETIKGEPITEELIDKLVREAEEGWDVEELIRQGKAVAIPPLEQDVASDDRSRPAGPTQRPPRRG